MRKIKIVGSGASRHKASPNTKKAMGIDDIAEVSLENFETLTDPPFKPKLELIEADPHTPPTMDAQTDQNITTEGDDPNRPDAGDIAQKAPEYENSNSIEEHIPPHEGEHVKQGELDEQIRKMKAEFTNKFARATKLFDIKIAAGVEQEINRQTFVHTTADDPGVTVEALDQKIADAEAFLGQIQNTQKTAEVTNNINPRIPRGFGNGVARSDSPFADDLEMVILGGS